MSTQAASAPGAEPGRRVRADAQRNLDALLEAAKAVFAESGVDAPVRTIAARAGVGVATLYRHFPTRGELVAAVYRREVDASAELAARLSAEYAPGEALAQWLLRFTEFVATKRGLHAALQSGDPALDALPAYFDAHLAPALDGLLSAAAAAGALRSEASAGELLRAVALLSGQAHDGTNGQRMVELLIDGLVTR